MADSRFDDGVVGHKVTVGNIDHSVAAIGAGAQVIYTNVERALTAVEIVEQAEAFGRKRLAEAVTAYVERLQRQAERAFHKRSRGNPYKALLEYDISDAALFYGRSAAIDALLIGLERGPLTVLHADGGAGKTSLLKAGIEPRLLADGHMPLYVRPYETPIPEAVKRCLLPRWEQTPGLRAASLHAFLRQATDLLGGKRLVVMLDQFEEVFTVQTAEARAEFAAELAVCLDDDLLPVRWILALRSECFGQLSTFQPQVRQPFANQYLLSAFNRDDAEEVIILPAQLRDLTYESGLVEKLIDDLGPEKISPPQLQLVCHTLVEGLAPGEKQLTRTAYEQFDCADGILRDYLDSVLARNLSPADREPAWQLLAAIAGQSIGYATEAELVARLRTYAVSAADARRVLNLLETNRLVRLSGQRYQLTSDSLLPRIRQWAAERAASELARTEVARQLEHIRASALRGMFGGAVGFSLAFLYTFGPQTGDKSLLFYITAVRALPGAVAGFLLIFLVDVARASYQGPQRWIRWRVGGLAGAGAFASAVLFNILMRSVTDPLALLLAAVEGALWGLVAGLGTVWVMDAEHPPGRMLLDIMAVALADGLVLGLADAVIDVDAFGSPPSAALVGLAGAIMPLCILAAASLARGRRREAVL